MVCWRAKELWRDPVVGLSRSTPVEALAAFEVLKRGNRSHILTSALLSFEAKQKGTEDGQFS